MARTTATDDIRKALNDNVYQTYRGNFFVDNVLLMPSPARVKGYFLQDNSGYSSIEPIELLDGCERLEVRELTPVEAHNLAFVLCDHIARTDRLEKPVAEISSALASSFLNQLAKPIVPSEPKDSLPEVCRSP